VVWQRDGIVGLQTPAESRPDRVDVAVFGGGLTGLSAALFLAEAGLSVLVVEARTAGDGASGRNGGQILTGVNPSFRELAREAGEHWARTLYREGDRAVEDVAELVARLKIACDFHRGGHLAVAVDGDRLDALEADRDALGGPLRMLDRAGVEMCLGFPGYVGGLYDPRSATANPYRLTLGIGRAAVTRGVHIVEHARGRLEPRPGHFVVHGAGRPVRAERVLVATNAFLSETVPALKLRVRRVSGTVIATKPLPDAARARILPGRPAVFEESDRYAHFQRTADGRLVFGGRAHADASTGVDGVVRFLRTLIPELAGVTVSHAWTGPLGITASGLPTWGETGDGTLYVGGYSGHGVALSVRLGLELGRYLATGAEPDWPRMLPFRHGFSHRSIKRFRPPARPPRRFPALR